MSLHRTISSFMMLSTVVASLDVRERVQMLRSVRSNKEWLPQIYVLRVWDGEFLSAKYSVVSVVQTVPSSGPGGYYYSDCVRFTLSRQYLCGLPVKAAVDEVRKIIYVVYGNGPTVRIFDVEIQEKTDNGYYLLRAVSQGICVEVPIRLQAENTCASVGPNFSLADISVDKGSGSLVAHFSTESTQFSSTEQCPRAICSATSIYDGQNITSLDYNSGSNVIHSCGWNLVVFGGCLTFSTGGFATLSKFLLLPNETDGADGKFGFTKYDRNGIVCDRAYHDAVHFLRSLTNDGFVRSLEEHIPPGESLCEFVTKTLILVGGWGKNVLFTVGRSFFVAARVGGRWYNENAKLKMTSLSSLVNQDSPRSLIQQSSVVNAHVLFKLLDLEGNITIRSLPLNVPLIKRYRWCAFCKRVERRKRRNAQGERIATYKICRTCKRRGLKKLDGFPERFECYYCSDECMRRDWKTHRNLHKLL